MNEQVGFTDPKRQKQLVKYYLSSLNAINTDLVIVDRRIAQLIKADDQLKTLFAKITFISGLGMANAIEVILTSDEFRAINDPKKLACFFFFVNPNSLFIGNDVSDLRIS